MTSINIEEVIKKSAKSAVWAWHQSEDGLDDLVNDLWVWYLETPSTQRKLEGLSKSEAIKTVRLRAVQLLSRNQMEANNFRGTNLYSADAVKDVLIGRSTNKYLVSILGKAQDALEDKNEDHAAAIRSRYEDGVVPEQGNHYVLVRAVKSLTELVNVIAITEGLTTGDDGTFAPSSGSNGIGRRADQFPELRRQRNGPVSDPTGNTALMLMEHPELRDEYLSETPLREFLGGKGA